MEFIAEAVRWLWDHRDVMVGFAVVVGVLVAVDAVLKPDWK